MKNKKIILTGLVATFILTGAVLLSVPTFANEEASSIFNPFKRVAEILNIDESKLNDAFFQARKEHLDQLLEDGIITQDEYNQRLEMIKDGNFRGFRRQSSRARRVGKFMMNDLADYLDMDVKDLLKEIRSGKSIEDIVVDHGKELDKVKDYLVTKGEEKIDELESEGKITEAQAKFMRDHLEDRVDRFLSKKHLLSGFGNKRNGRFGMENGNFKQGIQR